MWQQIYVPLEGNLGLSCAVAAIPIFVVLFLIGLRRKPAWISSLAGLAAAFLVAVAVYRMPVGKTVSATLYGGAFGLFPIGWVVFWAILLYRLAVESGQFTLIKDSLGSLTPDRRLQALLIAFAFGAFIEGASGFGTPVAVAGAMLAGLGFSPFYAAGICLLANTAPVAFGAIGIPIVTLAGTTGLPLDRLSAGVGRICAPISLFIPAYLIWVMGGFKALKKVIPAVAVCGIAFAGMQFFISNFVGVYLTDILASLTAIAALTALLRFWKPRETAEVGTSKREAAWSVNEGAGLSPAITHSPRSLLRAWGPYGFLVVLVLLWGYAPVQGFLNRVNLSFAWPGLHNLIQRMPPVVAQPAAYPALFNFNWLSASGTACLVACLLSVVWLRMSMKTFLGILARTARQMFFAELTIAAVLSLAFLMNYSGATATLGIGFAATGRLFPFFSALLGWLGVFLTGSDTSSNALFGNLQVVTAGKLHMSPLLMASSNSAGGVMGKMISLQSIAVAAAATNLKPEEEPKLFRFTLRHSLFLAAVVGLVVTFYAYVAPRLAP
ncbi:MAG: lactate permease LctP family transporter [Acidobacteriia bacterium]|nr:lactate permease LctP family transporter [Terriglobia bacterium]